MKFSNRISAGLAAAVAPAIALFASGSAAATNCEDLVGLSLDDGVITSAQVLAAGEFMIPGAPVPAGANPYESLPPFCRVSATLTPSADSDIKMELWLPASGWNGKFLAVGNGGWGGVIGYSAMAAGLQAGYATAGTDTGHTGNNADFALGHPEKLVDFGYRAVHVMAVQSKLIINTHYGAAASLAYFNGCSQGGRQGLAAAQHYPEDFNGIIAGAPAWNLMRMHAARTALNIAVNKDADSVIPPTKYAMINDAVLQSCDALDGVQDGVLENPAQCRFDYAALACQGEDGPACLTPGQVESAKLMTSPLKDEKSGSVLYEGHLMPGSELGWATIGGPAPIGLSLSGLQNVLFQDRAWDYHSLNAANDIELAAVSDGGATYSGDANLKPFFDQGGKLLMYHGWSDPQVNPLNSVIYYNKVLETVGAQQSADSIALFMMPGVNHCAGGPGTDTFDKLGVLERWVEQQETPTLITASHLVDGTVDKTRPLCPYGQTAHYDGDGDINNAANFSCKPWSE